MHNIQDVNFCTLYTKRQKKSLLCCSDSMSFSGVTLGMGAPLLAPPSPIWRPLSPQEAVLLNVSFKIKSQHKNENDVKK